MLKINLLSNFKPTSHSINVSVTRFFAVEAEKILDYNSDKYQFLKKSEIPTYHFQKSLRRLPIPKLKDTCHRYLNAVEAVYGSDSFDFKHTEKSINEFAEGDGLILHDALVAFDKQNKHTSYIAESWFDIYLRSRLPCPINFNPFMMFAPDKEARYNNQLVRATNFVLSCGRFKRALDAECLAPEVYHLNPEKSDTKLFRRVCRTLPSNLSWFGAVAFKAFPLDMSQYPSLFGGSRIPQYEKDRLHLNLKSRHFLVIRNGLFYTVNLFDEDGKLLKPKVVHSCISKILSISEKSTLNIGSLTTLNRDTWAKAREELLSIYDGYNAASLSKIDDALFALCLDEKIGDVPVELTAKADHSYLVESLLSGGDGSNRWFDKCFQLIIDGHGMATINFEHSWGDGVAILRLMEESLRDTTENRFVRVEDKPDNSYIKDNLVKLEWKLNDSLRSQIQDAQKKHLTQSSKLQFATVEYTDMDRNTIKKYNLSPDSIMQLAIQLAFYRTYKTFVPTYESCSTAAFLKGRTECLRSATTATRSAVLAFENSGSDASTKLSLLKNVSTVHSQLAKEATIGQGFDRHLLGLKITSERLKKPLPEFFKNKTYAQMNHFVLSTSTLSTDTIVFGGFGPVVDDGFGIGYNVTSKLGAVVSSYKKNRDAQKFCNAMAISLDMIKRVFDDVE